MRCVRSFVFDHDANSDSCTEITDRRLYFADRRRCDTGLTSHSPAATIIYASGLRSNGGSVFGRKAGKNPERPSSELPVNCSY